MARSAAPPILSRSTSAQRAARAAAVRVPTTAKPVSGSYYGRSGILEGWSWSGWWRLGCWGGLATLTLAGLPVATVIAAKRERGIGLVHDRTVGVETIQLR